MNMRKNTVKQNMLKFNYKPNSSPKGLMHQIRGKSYCDLPASEVLKLKLLSHRAINEKPALNIIYVSSLQEENTSILSDLWQYKLTLKSGQSK